jgi:hypothetical protein
MSAIAVISESSPDDRQPSSKFCGMMPTPIKKHLQIGVDVSGTPVDSRRACPDRFAGSDAFAAAHRGVIEQVHPTEVVRRHRTIGRPPLEELFAENSDTSARNLRIREARDRFHYRVSEIARHLSLHYGSVSRIAAARQVGRGGQPANRIAGTLTAPEIASPLGG